MPYSFEVVFSLARLEEYLLSVIVSNDSEKVSMLAADHGHENATSGSTNEAQVKKICAAQLPTVMNEMVRLSTDVVTAPALLINSVAPSASTLSRILVAHNVFTIVNQVRTTQSTFHALAASPPQILCDQDYIMDKGGTVVHCVKLVMELSHSCNSIKTMGARVTNSAEVPLNINVVPLPTDGESIQSQCSFNVHETMSIACPYHGHSLSIAGYGVAFCTHGSSPCAVNANVVDNITSTSVFCVPHTGFNEYKAPSAHCHVLSIVAATDTSPSCVLCLETEEHTPISKAVISLEVADSVADSTLDAVLSLVHVDA